jgi:chaperonin GroEL
MSKHTQYGADARDAILRGVDFLVDAVALTEGPRGRNVIMGQRALGQTPKVSRDGVTVANYVDPVDPTEQMGADLIREACQKTDNVVGDGTTCTAVLARAMIHAGFDLITKGANPLAMERGIHKATALVIDRLRKMAVEVSGDKVFQVATVSAHGDTEIGWLVAEAVEKAGKDGIVTAEPSVTAKTFVENAPGLELEKSNLLSPVFITHPEEMKAELPNCRILLWEGVISSAKAVVPILSQVKADNTPLLIIAGGYEAEALACIIKNKAALALPVNAVRMEAYGDRRKEVMRDIAALVGGTAYTEDMGMKIETVDLKKLGVARKVVTTMAKTQIIDGKGSQVELAGRIAHIRTAIEAAAPAEQPPLKTRLAALLGGITIIKVGGTTVTEMEEKRDRVVDALSAAKAAVESGVVAGGGTAIFNAAFGLSERTPPVASEEGPGFSVVASAGRAVVRQIAENAGVNANEIIGTLLSSHEGLGYNAVTGEFENLVNAGIIDPVKVVIEALKNAAAVACSILTMGATVSEIKQEKQNG